MEHLAILAVAFGLAFCLVYIDDKCKRARLIIAIVPMPEEVQSIVRRKSTTLADISMLVPSV
jgi:hypothetical protein